MKALLLAAVLIAQPAVSSEKVWVTEGCTGFVSTEDWTFFTYASTDGRETFVCQPASPPAPHTRTIVRCTNGDQAVLEIVDKNIVFYGVTLYPKDSPNVICD